ncbi:cytochrome P450 [Granulicella sp. dw_53]|uniref:cytochrome P450 n=1 Tax=Granulicella sp. dw_53 TaxID=2719792 RepID=UPI001BD55724|nr:cytochrome P450 [Granulicella sp. dw_53]
MFDHLAPENLQNPFDLYKRLREQRPIYWSEKYSFWMLTRYHDVKSVLQSPRQYSSSSAVAMDRRAQELPQSVRASFELGQRFYQRHIQASDPPAHTSQRQAVMKGFMPLVLGVLKTSIESRVNLLLDDVERVGSCDFVTQVAHPLPSSVIFDLLGVPPEQYDAVRETADLLWTFPSAVHKADVQALEQIAEKIKRTEAALMHLIRLRRHEPKEDLISALANPDCQLEQMSDADIVVLCVFLLISGRETTTNLLSGSLGHLLQHRDQWEMLITAPELLPSAVEELLRFISPVLWVARITTEDIEMDGHVFPKGSDVRLGIGAANHDPAQFVDPDNLDITRSNVSSIAFGYGMHTCLGAALARMQAQTVLSALLQRMPRIKLEIDHFEYHPIYWLRVLKSLPISVRG